MRRQKPGEDLIKCLQSGQIGSSVMAAAWVEALEASGRLALAKLGGISS